MTTISDLLGMVQKALLGPNATLPAPSYATDAGGRVYMPGDWPTQGGQYPILKVSVPRDIKQSIGRSGPPEFTVTTTIRIVGEVSVPGQANDAGAAVALAAALQLGRQIEIAVIGSYPLTASIQQIASVDTQIAFQDGETHLAGVQMDLTLEYYQGPEDFAPIAADDIDEMDVTLTNYPPLGFTADLNP